jgi:hypothetical protein
VGGQSLRKHNDKLNPVFSYINRKEAKILNLKNDGGSLLFPLNAYVCLLTHLFCHDCSVSLISIIINVHMASRSDDCNNDCFCSQSDNIIHHSGHISKFIPAGAVVIEKIIFHSCYFLCIRAECIKNMEINFTISVAIHINMKGYID